MTHRVVVWSEPDGHVQLWYVGHQVDHGHDPHQPQHQVQCDSSLVDWPRLLVWLVSRDEVSETNSGERDEAVVEGVKPRPERLHQIKNDCGDDEEEDEDAETNNREVHQPDRDKILKWGQEENKC